MASVTGGECRVFERPEYVVKGAAPYDQKWVDGNIEAGVSGCGWDRPKLRPPELDQRRSAPRLKAAPRASRVSHSSWRSRVKRFVAPSAVAAPAPPPVAVEAVPPAEEPPAVTVVRTTPVTAVPLPPPDPLDELLGRR